MNAKQFAKEIKSPLAQGCGLKQKWKKKSASRQPSPLAQGCGLKQKSLPTIIYPLASPLAQGCGLKDKGLLSLSIVTRLLSQMIEKNFMIIPFTAEHLHGGFKKVLSVARSSGRDYLKSEELRSDPILMPFMKQFGEQALYQQMVPIAIEWWLLLIDDPDIPSKQSVECISYVSYILSMRTISAVMGKIHETEQQERMASTLALFLWRAYLKDKRLITKAWSVIKNCCEIYFKEKSEIVTFDYLLKYLRNIMEKVTVLTDDEKRIALFEIPEYFSPNEKEKFSIYFIKNKPIFMK